MTPDRRIFLLTFLACGAALLGSFVASRLPVLEPCGVLLIAALAVWGYSRSFAAGTAVVLAELVCGSLGRSYALPWGGISVREVLFAIAIAATVVHVVREHGRTLKIVPKPVVAACGLLAIAVGWGIVRGLLLRPPGAIIGDANAYFFLLLLPTFLIALRERQDRALLLSVVLGAAAASAVQTISIFFLATHGAIPSTTHPLYKWIRDFGFGELTPGVGGFARVFFQSHLWSAAVFLIVPLLLVAKRDVKDQRWLWLPGALAATTLFLSFSRTLWLAVAAASLVGLALMLGRAEMRRQVPKLLLIVVALSVLGVGTPFFMTRGVGGAVSGRVSVAGEPAADSRMNLLRVMWPAIREHPLLGSGFGKELTYQTRDPRLLAYFPDGTYTTSAFEWGWLDFWLKMGILGPLAFVGLVLGVLQASWRAMHGDPDGPWLHLGLFLSVVMVAVAHVVSPWLNHPLGIGLTLFALGNALAVKKTDPAKK